MVLELSGNQISAVGDNVSNMAMLRDFDLSGNSLTRVSDALCNLSKLEVRSQDGSVQTDVLQEACCSDLLRRFIRQREGSIGLSFILCLWRCTVLQMISQLLLHALYLSVPQPE